MAPAAALAVSQRAGAPTSLRPLHIYITCATHRRAAVMPEGAVRSIKDASFDPCAGHS